LFASFHGPAVHHFQFGSIDLGDLASVLDVDEYVPLPVECGELGFASQGNRADNLSGLRVDHTGIVAASIEAKDAMGSGLVNDEIGFRSDIDTRKHFQSLGVEFDDLVSAASGDEALAEIRC